MSEGIPGGVVRQEERERERAEHRVAVLDAGGQYVDLVKKAIERQGTPADVLSLQTPREELEAKYDAIVISGSPASSHTEAAPQPDPTLWGTELPILGICYGMQAMAVSHGGRVAKNAIREDGRVTTIVDTTHRLFKGNKKDFTGLFTHGDFVTALPEGFTAIGQHQLSDGSPAYSAIAKGNKIGVQFHPEVFDDTPEGYQLFKNFLHGVAGIEPDEAFQEARLETIMAKKRQEIAEQVGDRHVIAFVSGGVDSTVAATLAASVIAPEKFHAFYIDNGFMRDEDEMVIDALTAAGIKVIKWDATEQFEQATAEIDGVRYGPLVTVTDPQIKRKIIGKTFIDVQSDILKSLDLDEALLLQGTNAADRIESGHSKGGTHTDVIKTHHNQVQEVQKLKALGLLIEPLDDLFKDEIRALGHELGLPYDLVERPPFPGPGTAIRIIGAQENQSILKQAFNLKAFMLSYRVRRFMRARKYSAEVAEHRVLPVKSVGVGGDERSYANVVAVHSSEMSSDTMAALAHDVPAHFRGEVNRVVLALGYKSLRQARVTKTLLDAEARTQLRHADRIVFEAMRSFDVLHNIKQMPVILIPVSYGKKGERSIVLRPVTTSTFMTVQAMLPGRDLPHEFFDIASSRILTEVPGISQVFLDLTNKPPGTTEWE